MPYVSANDTTFDVDVVVFDKDGTLVDLDALWFPAARCWVEAIAAGDDELSAALADRLGIDMDGQRLVPDGIAAASTFAAIKQATVGELAARAWAEDRIDAAMRAAGMASDRAAPDEGTTTLADIPTLFAQLSAAGLIVAVFTSADRNSTLEFLRQIGADEVVTMVVTANDVDHPKPHPDGLLRIVDELACPANRILMVGDSVFDHLAARAAGAWFVAVGHQAGAADGADASIDCIDQITLR